MDPGFISELVCVAASGPHPTLSMSPHVSDVNAHANFVVEMVI